MALDLSQVRQALALVSVLCCLFGALPVASAQDAGVVLSDASDAGLQGDAAVDAATPGPWSPDRAPFEPEKRTPAPQVVAAQDAGVEEAADAAVVARTASDAPAPSEPTEASGTTVAASSEALPLTGQGQSASFWTDDGAQGSSSLSDLVSVVVDERHGPAAFWGWLLLALLAWLLDRTLRRRSERFNETGLFPSLMSVASLLWRGAVFMALVFFILRTLPPSWLPELKWVVFAVLGVSLWAMRGVLSDLVARVIIAVDGKVRPRLMVQTKALTGRIARVGVRQTDVVDPIGRTWALPNRLLLSAQVREPSETHVHASLAIDVSDKRLIEDAALSSAWIHPDGEVHVWRDAADIHLWHVETQLISNDFERVFRSDLAERVREQVHFRQNGENDAALNPRPSAPPASRRSKRPSSRPSQRSQKSDSSRPEEG